jgi:hypothetical protein
MKDYHIGFLIFRTIALTISAATLTFEIFPQTPLALPILPDYRITAFAGDGTAGSGGDGGPAALAQLEGPLDLGVDTQGNVYIADFYGERIRKVSVDGTISTLVSSDNRGYGGDGGPVAEALFEGPRAVVPDRKGNLYIADIRNDRIRKVDTNGIVSTFAGTGEAGFAGDGGPAAQAKLNSPLRLHLDQADNVYFFDLTYRIRRIDTNGIITTIAGNGTSGYSGDNGPATNAEISVIDELAIDHAGNVYFTDDSHDRIRKIDSSGIITTVAGSGTNGLSGGGGPATSARLNHPTGVLVDSIGNIFIGDQGRVRRVDTNGVILTIAGGRYSMTGDGGPALQAGIQGSARGLAFLPNGDILFCSGNTVRTLSLTTNTVPVFWSYASLPPPGSPVDFGTRTFDDVSGMWPSTFIYLHNMGTADLVIQSVEILGDSSAFQLRLQNSSYEPLSLPHRIPEGLSDESLSLEISCLLPLSTAVTNTAVVRIISNDPEVPVVTHNLRAAVIASDSVNPEYEYTLEETLLFLMLFPGAIDDAGSLRGQSVHAQEIPDQVTLRLDSTMAHSLTSEVPSFLGGGSVVLSNFTGQVTVSLRAIPGEPDYRAITIENGVFTAPSFLLPNGIATGSNTLTFGSAVQSTGRFNTTNGNYTATATATIVNDLFPAGFPVQGTYSGAFDFASRRASVRSRSTDVFERTTRLKYLRSLQSLLLTWTRPGVVEAATNILGPWAARSNAVSPYRVDTTQDQYRFFRLRSTRN